MANLSESDYKNINIFVKSVLNSFDCINYLVTLDQNGQKHSKYYQDYLEILKEFIELENKAFKDLATDFEKSAYVLEAIRNLDAFKTSPLKNVQNFSTILLLAKSEATQIVLAHIFNKFAAWSVDNSFGFLTSMTSGIAPEEIKDIHKSVFFDTEFRFRLSVDLIYLVLAILEKIKEEQCSEEMKKEMLKLQYELSFLMPDVTDTMVNNDFVITKEPYLLHGSIRQLHKVSIDKENQEKMELLTFLAGGQIMALLELIDIDLNDANNMLSALCFQAVLRSILVIADDKTREQIRNFIKDNIKFLQYNELEDNNSIKIKELLKEVLDNEENDRTIPQMIYLNRS